MKRSNLTLEAIRNIKQVGTIMASSIFLAKKLIKGIDFSKKLNVLELGAGTGAITKEILNNLSSASVLYSYENNENLAHTLKKSIKDSRLIVKDDCVSTLDNLQDNYFDVVISSLPLSLFSHEFKNKIYRDVRSKLRSSGTFIQYQYSLSDYKNIDHSFDDCKVEFCLLNVPPAFIYKAKNPAEVVQLSELTVKPSFLESV